MPSPISPQNMRFPSTGLEDHDASGPSSASTGSSSHPHLRIAASSTSTEPGVPVNRPIIWDQPNQTSLNLPRVAGGTQATTPGPEGTAMDFIEHFIASLRAFEQASIPARSIIDKLESPIQDLKEQMMAKGRDWFTPQEARLRTNRSAGYFEDRLRSLGGRSRLEAWREEGLAEQTLSDGASGRGVWLIHASALRAAHVPARPDWEIPEHNEEIDDDELEKLFQEFQDDTRGLDNRGEVA